MMSFEGEARVKPWKKCLVQKADPIIDTLKIIDTAELQIALVVDNEGRLLGTVTDGDVRRAIIRGVNLHDAVYTIMNSNPASVRCGQSKEAILSLMKERGIRQVPVVGEDKCVLGLESLSELLSSSKHDNWVVLMAGGLGRRLSPMTDSCPKPMLRVGDQPLIETIIEGFSGNGFQKFFISINYKGEMIKDYFGDGSSRGVEIKYLEESEQLGTAGSLSLLPSLPERPVLVMNGDLLTKLNFQRLIDFHCERGVAATMCVREYDFQVPYGVVQVEDGLISSISEKPIHRFFVNAGIYVISPEVLHLIAKNEYLDMPSFFQKLAASNRPTAAFPIREYWLDIGQYPDLERAKADYQELFR